MPDNEVILAQPTIDLDQWNRQIQTMLGDVNKIEAQMKALGDIGTAELKINTTGDLDTTKRTLDDLDAGVTSEVDVSLTGDAEVKNQLEDIKGLLSTANKLAIIDMIFNVPEAFGAFADTLMNLPGVSTLVELDTAMATLEGRTGRMIPGAKELIIDLYTNAWSDSITEVEGVIEAASNLGIEMDDLEEAVKAAFNLEALGFDDAAENLRTLDSMVKNELAPDFNTAADILAAGLQTGANRGDDLLDTFDEYGAKFAEMRISGEGALGFIVSGLEAGAQNSDRVADGIHELGIRLSEIGEDENIAAAFAQLDDLSDIDLEGMRLEWEAGDLSGDEFFAAFFESLNQAIETDPTQGKLIASKLIGTMAEDFSAEAFAQLTPVWDESIYGPLEERAAVAAATVNDTLGTAMTELTRTLEVEVADALNETFDIEGLIDKATDAAQRFASALREGRGVGGALEVALQIPGLEDTFHKIESFLANLGISLMEAFAGVLEFLGKDASGIRAEVARLAEGQAAFDIRVATNEDEIKDAIQRAINRGVEGTGLIEAGGRAVEQLVAEGDVQRARDVVAEFERLQSIQADVRAAVPEGVEGGGLFGEEILGFAGKEFDLSVDAVRLLAGEDLDVSGLRPMIDAGVEVLQTQLDDAIAASDWDAISTLMASLAVDEETGDVVEGFNAIQERSKRATEGINQDNVTLVMGIQEHQTAFGDLTEVVTTGGEEQAETMDSVTTATEGTDDAVGALGSTVIAVMPTVTQLFSQFLTGISSGSASAIGMLTALATQFTSILNSVQRLEGLAGDALPSGPMPAHQAGGVTDPGFFTAGERGPEMMFSDSSMAVWNNATTESFMAALRGGGGVGGVSNTTRNVNAPMYNTWNVTNGVQLDTSLAFVDQMRGFG